MDIDRTTMMGSASPANLASDEQCPACETSIPGGDEFCPKCGYQRGTWAGDGQPALASSNGAAPTATAASGPALWTLTGSGQSWPLSAGTYIIGRGEVDIRVDDSYASRRHAQLEVTASSVTLTDVGSSNGTFVGERRLEANAPEELADGANFKIANTELTLAQSHASADATVVQQQESAPPEGTQVMDTGSGLQQDSEGTTIDEQAQLSPDQEVQSPAEPSTSHWELQREGGETIPLGFGECTLGRKEAASCMVGGDSYISGVHARLIANEDRLEVTDLGSTNGTFVNDARLDPEQPWKLASGDRLRLGQTTFLVVNNKPALTEGQADEQKEPTE